MDEMKLYLWRNNLNSHLKNSYEKYIAVTLCNRYVTNIFYTFDIKRNEKQGI